MDNISEKKLNILNTSFDNGIFNLIIGIDDPKYEKRIKSTLKINNYNMVIAPQSSDIVKLIDSETKFDLVVLDFSDKNINYELTKLLRERYSLFELPILIISHKDDTKDIIYSFEFGANDYISKPFNDNELIARVNTLLTLKFSIDSAISAARNYESEKQQRLFAETLSDLTRFLTSTLNMNDVLKKFLEYLLPFVKFDKSLILVKEDDEFKTNLTVGFGDEIDIIENFANFIKIEVVDNGMFVNNDFNNSKYNLKVELDGSLIGIPILLRGEIFGIISLFSETKNYYQDNEVGMLFSFAGQAGMALDNARLFEEVKKLATIDSLTKLYNRRYFFEVAEREFIESKRFDTSLSIIMIDIDNFKKVNDTYGHTIGDEFIKYVADKTAKSVRKADIVCRYGGEEFIVLLPGTDIDTAMMVAERIRKNIESGFVETRKYDNLFITSSFGVSHKEDETTNIEEVIHKADEALYLAKSKGKNIVCSI